MPGVVARWDGASGVCAEVIPMTRMSLAWLIDQVKSRFEEMVPCEAAELLAAGRSEK